MRQGIVTFLFIVGLAVAEFLCFTLLRKAGFPTGAAVVITLTSCLGIFALFVGLFLLRNGAEYGSGSYNTEMDVAREAYARREAMARAAAESADDGNGFAKPNPSYSLEWNQEGERSFDSESHEEEPVIRDPFSLALQDRAEELADILVESAKELSRFDAAALRTLDKNAPGAAEGAVIAMKIHAAMEQRVADIAEYLAAGANVDPEYGQSLLHGDLETPNDDQLSALFGIDPVPPIKLSEVNFHMRMLLKRISRRRSFYKGVSEDLLLVRSSRHTLVADPLAEGSGESETPSHEPSDAADSMSAHDESLPPSPFEDLPSPTSTEDELGTQSDTETGSDVGIEIGRESELAAASTSSDDGTVEAPENPSSSSDATAEVPPSTATLESLPSEELQTGDLKPDAPKDDAAETKETIDPPTPAAESGAGELTAEPGEPTDIEATPTGTPAIELFKLH